MHEINQNYNRMIVIDFLFTFGVISHLPILCLRPRGQELD